MKKERKELVHEDHLSTIATAHVGTNNNFLFIAVTVFIFVITLSPELLIKSVYLQIQLSLCMMLFVHAIFARSKIISQYTGELEIFGTYTFRTGLVFFMNSWGIIIAQLIGKSMGLFFIGAYLLFMISYGVLTNIARKKYNKSLKIFREIVAIALVLILGVYPILTG